MKNHWTFMKFKNKLIETLDFIRQIDMNFNNGILKKKNFLKKNKYLILKIKNIIRSFK